MSEEIREYDRLRWGEDPLDGIYGNLSHISYYSHLAWMISRYKQIGGDNKYDGQYHTLCRSMNRRIRQNPIMNLPTYPGESIYIPDMLVAIVAGSTIRWFDKSHYLLADIALVGEAITLAMRTTALKTKMTTQPRDLVVWE